MTFQEKLIILRKNNGLTQDDFAKAVGVSRQAVYKWENGTSYPEIQKLIEMRELFNISLDNLFDDTYEIEAPEKKKRRKTQAPKAAPKVKEAPVAKEEPIDEVEPAVEASPVVEEVPTVEAVTKVEEAPAPKVTEETVAKREPLSSKNYEELRRVDVHVPEADVKDEEDEAPQEKKLSFFDRLFGRR